ncbi:OmpA family protein [Massilia aerilata]|uniref:OmpA family protein n=1 Tax=Massilia aerilata TaxID=453817 RepID=A0ABW0S015_9BURK
MKKFRLAILICSTAAMLASCTTAPTTGIGFNYEVDNAKANGIVQVFDLSGNTVVQLRDMNLKTTHFLDGKNAPIVFKIVGQNAVLAGMYSSFTVSSPAAASRVIRKEPAPNVLPAPVTPAPRSVTTLAGTKLTAADSDEAIAAEIARMRKEIAELKTMIAAAAHEPAPDRPASAVADAGRVDATEPSVVIVSFQNNSRQFNPAHEQRTQLLALSHTAQNISVRGFTDSDFATNGSVALAKARAEAAKRYLLSMGVAPAKIVVSFDGAGKFIADNRSPAGRAANRRVEIVGT